MSKCTIKSLKSIKMFASLLLPFGKTCIKACLTHEIKNIFYPQLLVAQQD